MNIVLVVIDSLRQDHVGAYGNKWIHTPHLDAFAKEAVRFTRCYSDAEPTLPMRRSLHTGIRTYPYIGHRGYKGDGDRWMGWGPIPEEQDTISEILRDNGYRTGFLSDAYHQFKPSKNFHRGFDSWMWIRGQEMDRFRTGPEIPESVYQNHLNDKVKDNIYVKKFLRKYLNNNHDRRSEEDYFPALLFKEGARWVLDNYDADNFFLLIDSFDPHEPWDPPIHYRKMYDPDDDVVDQILSPYYFWKDIFTPRELKRVQANYAGEVTMVDRWFGFLMDVLKMSERLDDTVVAVISDHGHNLGHDPQDKGIVGKQGHPMTRAVADLVCMIRHPAGEGAGMVCDNLVYVHDFSRTLLSLVGVEPENEMEGKNFWPAVSDPSMTVQDHVTIGYGSLITVINNEWWYNANFWGEGNLLYALKDDPKLINNLADDHPGICKDMLDLAIEDAGGEIPEVVHRYRDKTKVFHFAEYPFETAERGVSFR